MRLIHKVLNAVKIQQPVVFCLEGDQRGITCFFLLFLHTHTQRLHSANGECERLFIKLLFIAQRAEQQLGVTFRSIRGEMQRAKIMALLTEKSCRPLCRIVLRRINLSAIEGVLHRKRRKGEHWMKKEKQKDRKNRLDDKCCSASGEERTETLMFFCSCLLEVQW